MTMRFLKQNLLNTTTMVNIPGNTGTAIENLFDRDVNTKWESIGFTGDTNVSIFITFNTSTAINSIFFQNHNLKNFSIQYDTLTNDFTPSINVLGTNSDTSNYFTFNTQTANSIIITLRQTIEGGGVEKNMGEIYVNGLLLSFERNPSAADYKPIKDRKQVIHKMPDGGVNQLIIRDKFKAQIKWKYLTSSFTSQLESIYDTGTAFFFLPFATTTAWDGKASEMVWTNDFDFRHSSNNKDAGFGGKIILEETA